MSICQQGRRAGFPLLFAVVIAGCAGAENEFQQPPPPPVTVANPILRTVPIYIEENGETEAVQRAEVRARVTGFLGPVELNLEEPVTGGEQLFQIEDEQYRATVGAAEAAQQAAEAAILVAEAQVGTLKVEVDRAKKEFERQTELLAQDATTQQQFDVADASYKSAQAQEAAAEANVAAAVGDRDKADQDKVQADINLAYTTVTAPIDGRITATEVKEGNLVEEGTHLATIVNREQIYANFSISDRDWLRLQRTRIEAREEGEPEERVDYSDVKILLQREIDDGFPFQGQLDYLDEEGVDQATGTFALRAIFENPDDLIFPGLFVRLRVPIARLENAVLIPESAIARDPQGTYVQVLAEDGTLARRNIVTALVVDAMSPDATDENAESTSVVRMAVVQQGLTPEDQVVTLGGFGIRPDTVVEATVESLEGIEVPQIELPFLDDGSADQTDDSADQTDDATSE